MKNILLSIVLLFTNILLVFHDVIAHDHIAVLLTQKTELHTDDHNDHFHAHTHDHQAGLTDLVEHLSEGDDHDHHHERHSHLENGLFISANQNNFKTNQFKVKDIAKPIFVLSILFTEDVFEKEEPVVFVAPDERATDQVYRTCSALRGPPFMA